MNNPDNINFKQTLKPFKLHNHTVESYDYNVEYVTFVFAEGFNVDIDVEDIILD